LNKKRVLDIGLVIIVFSMALLVYFQVSRLFRDVSEQLQQPEDTMEAEVAAAPTSTPEDENDTAPTLAPDFELTSVAGETVSLSDYQGTAVMINFWATWCPPCRAELPLIESFATHHADDLVVLAVNAGESRDVVAQFVTEFKYDLVWLLDPANDLASKFLIRGLPTSIFIDANGLIRARHIGLLNETLLRDYLGQAGVVE
jgi:thiol-disulfide isomerase/thioredoxin